MVSLPYASEVKTRLTIGAKACAGRDGFVGGEKVALGESQRCCGISLPHLLGGADNMATNATAANVTAANVTWQFAAWNLVVLVAAGAATLLIGVDSAMMTMAG
jgi:hypothetical protein